MIKQQLYTTTQYLKQKGITAVETAIILGSGLNEAISNFTPEVAIPYQDIPHFCTTTVKEHQGVLLYGSIEQRKVIVLQGRFHYYEGYSMEEVVFPTRTLIMMGVKNLILTNAAGGLNPAFSIGDIMMITDHINLFPNPLRGANLDQFGPRFPDMTQVYNKKVIQQVEAISKKTCLPVQKGVYIGSSGPTFETPAEYRFFRTIGADATGMSTVPEAIVAHHAGVRIVGFSVITNLAHTFDSEYKNDAHDVFKEGKKAALRLSTLITRLIPQL